LSPTRTINNTFHAALALAAHEVEATLKAVLAPFDGRLGDAMRYAVLNGGKRLRPFLVQQSAAMLGVDPAQALRVGAALECVHCYSLVHDDLPAMDNDDLRRGLPTTHKKFDDATAILAGDALLTLAFEILAAEPTHSKAHVRSNLVLDLAKAAGGGGMVGGQMHDIAAETSGFSSLDEISSMQDKKTGALFRFACESAAIMSESVRTPLRTYATKIGLAFQITDDVLDVKSTAAALGKATQKDKAKGKATFVDLLGLEGAERQALKLATEAKKALMIYGSKAEILQAAADFIVTREK
jgi:farnesyl diphosphate synthase